MEQRIRDSLEAITNLVYLAKATAHSDAKMSIHYLNMAEHEVEALAKNVDDFVNSLNCLD
jgi:hypothetical protein